MFDFSLPFLKNHSPSSFLGIDFGTVNVKGVVVDLTDEIPQIIGCGQIAWPEGSFDHGLIKNSPLVVQTLKKLLSELGVPSPNQVIYSLSGVLVHDFTTMAKITRTTSQDPVSESELSDICDRLEDAAGIEAAGQAAWWFGDPGAYLELIGSNISICKLDGYYASSPLGYRGSVLELGLATSFSTSQYLRGLQDISKKLGLKLLTVTSSFNALLKNLKDKDKPQFNALLVDVGGQVTNLGVVIGGGIVACASFPLGDWHFTLALSQALSIDWEKALQIRYNSLDDYSVDPSVVSQTLTRVCRYWACNLDVALESFSGVKKLPHQIIMLGGGKESPEIKAVFSDSRWLKKFPFGQEVEFLNFTFDDLFVRDLTGRLNKQEFLMVSCLAGFGAEVLNSQD